MLRAHPSLGRVARGLAAAALVLAAGCGATDPPIREFVVEEFNASTETFPNDLYLTEDLLVRTLEGAWMPGVAVRVQVSKGSVSPTAMTTNDLGVARTTWHLAIPGDSGEATLSACSSSNVERVCNYQPVVTLMLNP